MNTAINGPIMSVELPENLDGDFADLLQKKTKDWLAASVELYAFDFKKTVSCKQNTYRNLVAVSQQIRKAGRTLVSHSVTMELGQQFKMAGISDALNVTADFEHYLKKFSAKKSSGLDVQMINPFLEATLTTLEQQANTKCEAQKPQLINLDDKSRSNDVAIAGVISLSTDQFSGSITLAFPETVFLKIYESMCGETVDKINAEIEDAAGELLNIIYGSAKTKLNEQCDYKLVPVLPTILSGDKIKIRQTTYQKVIVLPFKTAFGLFHIEISFDPQK